MFSFNPGKSAKFINCRDFLFNYAAVGQFVQDNMGTLRAIVEQTWYA